MRSTARHRTAGVPATPGCRRSCPFGGDTYPNEGVAIPLRVIQCDSECRECGTAAIPGRRATDGKGRGHSMRKSYEGGRSGSALSLRRRRRSRSRAPRAATTGPLQRRGGSHEFVDGNPPLCPAAEGGKSFRVEASDLTEGGDVSGRQSGHPDHRARRRGGTLSWQLLDDALDVRRRRRRHEGWPGRDGLLLRRRPAGSTTRTPGSRRRSTRTAKPTRGRTGSATSTSASTRRATQASSDLVVDEDRRRHRWEKVYTWDVEKSVDKRQLELQAGRDRHGERGRSTSRRPARRRGTHVVTRHDHRRRTRTTSHVTGVAVTDRSPARSSTATAKPARRARASRCRRTAASTCTYSAPADSTDGRHELGDRDRLARTVSTCRTPARRTSRSATPTVEINKTVKAVDGKNTWNGIDETTSFTYDEKFRCSSQGRTNVVDLLGDNPSTRGGRDGLRARHGLGERDGARAADAAAADRLRLRLRR